MHGRHLCQIFAGQNPPGLTGHNLLRHEKKTLLRPDIRLINEIP
jgi:hypothetical protein